MMKKETHCNNPSCGKELTHTPGRRPKKYCTPKCRISHHIKKNQKPKFVRIETHNRVKEQLKALMENGGKINYIEATPDVYDAEPINPMILDEPGQFQIPTPNTLDELKSMCPPDLKGFERSMWIAKKRVEYGI